MTQPISFEQRLEQITQLCIELSNNQDMPSLMERILRVAQLMTHSDGGTLYLVSEDDRRLQFHISINNSLGMYQGGISGQKMQLPDLDLFDKKGQPNVNTVATYAANQRKAVNIADIY